jgi:SHS2 domain-containing protein
MLMKKFELLDIATADMAFAAYGKTLGEMFENAGLALSSIMFELDNVEPKTEEEIVVSADEDVVLLQKFLHELLFIFDTEHLIFSGFKVETDGKQLTAKCRGEKYDASRHKFNIDVKAVTYHKMEIKKDGELWKCTVVVDV